jgi:hypothetical protein
VAIPLFPKRLPLLRLIDPISDIRGAFTASQLLPSIHVGSGGVLNQ